MESIASDRIQAHMKALESIGNLGSNPGDGFLRAAYSNEETAAMKYIAQAGETLGLHARWDELGNMALETPGEFSQWVEAGSHLDTVPLGGNFDGAAGVVAGLEAIYSVLNTGETKAGLRLRVWRGEESSTYQSVSSGAKGAFGALDPAVLKNRFQGISLREAMISQGANPELIEKKEATISQDELNGIRAHFELHIEQGTLLEEKQAAVGIVTGIRGPHRFWVQLSGSFDHSGATPMGEEYRRDVNLALAYSLVRLNELAKDELKTGRDLVQTTGVINSNEELNRASPLVYANAVPKVSGFGYFSLDIRSCDTAFREEYVQRAKSLIAETAQEFAVECRFEEIGKGQGLKSLDPQVQQLLIQSAERAGLRYCLMPSGAWHDAAFVFQQKKGDGSSVPGGMIFIPCREGKSHCPEEYSSPEQIAGGATLLAHAMLELVN